MLDADAEPERPHRLQVVDARGELRDHLPGPSVVGREQVGEALRVVAAPAPPRHVAQVEAVVDAVVDEGDEPVLIDRIPEPQLGGDAVAEPAEQREAVAALGRGGEAEQLHRLHVVEQVSIRSRRSVVKFVDDDDIEMARIEIGEPRGVQALDRREDMLEALRAMATNP